MVLRKLSQTFMISLAFMVATFSSGLLQPAVAYATHQPPGSSTTKCEALDSDKEDTTDDPLTVTVTAPVDQLIDGYCVKAGSESSGDGPVYVEVNPAQSSVLISYPGGKAVSHYSVSYVAAPVEPTVTPTPSVNQEVVCGPDNDVFSVVDGDNYDVVDNLDGTFTLTAAAGYVFSTSGTNTETLTAPADDNTACPPQQVTTPSVNQEVVCGPENDIFSVVDGANYDVVDNLDGTFTLTADAGYVFSTSGTNTETLTAPADDNTTCPEEEEPKKVFVCKYVGTPGDDERLQTGQNPISVSVNAIPDGAEVGAYFADAQGRSFVLEFDNGQEEPDVSECPGGDSEEPQADIDYAIVCVEDGVKVTLTNSGDASGTATVNGTVHDVAANSVKEVVLDYDLGTPFMTEVTVTIGQTTSTQTVNCTPGGGGGTPETPVTPTTPGQTLGTTTSAAVETVLPAVLPATGGVDSPFMVIVASILAYGAAYFLQGRRLIARKEAMQA